MNRALLLTLAVPLAAACGASYSNRDAGTDRIVCTTEYVYVPVKVVNKQGAAVPNAIVTAKNVSRFQAGQPNTADAGPQTTITGTTNEQGVTSAIGESIGPGTVEISARLDTRTSNVVQTEWRCGECHCQVEPSTVTLTLSD